MAAVSGPLSGEGAGVALVRQVWRRPRLAGAPRRRLVPPLGRTPARVADRPRRRLDLARPGPTTGRRSPPPQGPLPPSANTPPRPPIPADLTTNAPGFIDLMECFAFHGVLRLCLGSAWGSAGDRMAGAGCGRAASWAGRARPSARRRGAADGRHRRAGRAPQGVAAKARSRRCSGRRAARGREAGHEAERGVPRAIGGVDGSCLRHRAVPRSGSAGRSAEGGHPWGGLRLPAPIWPRACSGSAG